MLYPLDNWVKALGFAYEVPAYVYPCEETASAGARIYVKFIVVSLAPHAARGDNARRDLGSICSSFYITESGIMR